MDTLLAVLKDLFAFVTGRTAGVTTAPAKELPAARAAVSSAESTPSALEPPSDAAEEEAVAHSLAATLGQREFVGVAHASVYTYPYRSFDGVLQQLTYGTPVTVHRRSGRFVEVTYDGIKGWLSCDDLTADQANVFPELHSGRTYLAGDIETQKIRRYLADEFNAAELLLPLQAGELVTYELQQRGHQLPWGDSRPRLPGQWQQLLRGSREVVIGVSPRTGSVMEYLDDEGRGHLAYVRSVTPEETIDVTAVGLHEEGQYTEATLPKAVWREWRPVFILPE